MELIYIFVKKSLILLEKCRIVLKLWLNFDFDFVAKFHNLLTKKGMQMP
jgi:hypothetical protein